MDEKPLIYEIRMPLAGRPGEYFTVCTAITVDGAIEVVRAILTQKDRGTTEICLIAKVQL